MPYWKSALTGDHGDDIVPNLTLGLSNHALHSPEDDQSLLIETSSCTPSSF